MIAVNLVRISDEEVVATIETSSGASAFTSVELDAIVAEHCPDLVTAYRSAWNADGTVTLSTPEGVPVYKLANG